MADEDDSLRAVFEYLMRKTYPEGSSKNAKRRIREHSHSFVVDSGILFHKSGQRLCRVITDPAERDRIVTQLHADAVSGNHYGQTATIRKVSDRFWWRNVAEDTRAFVRTCAVCQKANPSNKAPSASLHPVPVADLFHRWGIDLVGPLKETKNGNKYIVVATEYLTRWPGKVLYLFFFYISVAAVLCNCEKITL